MLDRLEGMNGWSWQILQGKQTCVRIRDNLLEQDRNAEGETGELRSMGSREVLMEPNKEDEQKWE